MFVYFKSRELFGFKSTTDISQIQTWFFFIGIIWVGLITPLQYAHLKEKKRKQDEVFSELLNYNKNILFKFPQSKFRSLGIKFNTRIFVPKKGILEFFKDGTTLVPKYYKGLTDNLDDNQLRFKVSDSVIEGMVGKSYKEKTILIDFDMSDQNKYNLSEDQKRYVRKAKFCSTIPILDNNKNPIAVLAVDSERKVRNTENIKNAWIEHLAEYASFIYKNIKL